LSCKSQKQSPTSLKWKQYFLFWFAYLRC
jgi:hypothetical protein